MVFKKSSKLHHSHILLCSLFMITFYPPPINSLDFNLSNIGPKNLNIDIEVENDAYISIQGIQVTSDELSVNHEQKSGRAMYIKPLHLWDNFSRNLTDFETHFSFVIDSQGGVGADGITFLLIPLGVFDISKGGAMGLPLRPNTFRPISPFVAIEFDTFNEQVFDPVNITTHVGIDVNSLRSNVTELWYSDIRSGIENEAWVSYNSTSKNLSVIFTGFKNNTRVLQGLYLIVDLREYLPEWVRIGFSASTGSAFERHNVKSWQFSSSLRIDENPVPSPYNPNEFKPEKEKEGSKKIGLVVGISVGLPVLVIGFVLLVIILWLRRIRPKEKDRFSIHISMDEAFEAMSGPKKFAYVQLSRATNNFDEEQKLGEGGFGEVYRGFLKESNSYVAVKRISKRSKQGIKEYLAEVKIISRLRHRNLVRLIGWCHEKRELLLVYEYMANASLDTHLFRGNKSLLKWETRYKIAKSLASALLYLHEEWEQCVVHRDVKPSNIMLDQNFDAKLGDFGLARLIDHEKGTQTTALAGTMGYMAPECISRGKTSKESDVYSFGIVSLEIACGRKSIDTSLVQESEAVLVEFVWDLYGRGNLLNVVDVKLSNDFGKEEMERLMIVGLWCAHPDYNFRPSIRQALLVLNFEAPLPVLPGRMPVATYLFHPMNLPFSLISFDSNTISPNRPTNSSNNS